MRDGSSVELAIKLHGHFAPGVALGIRMSEIALDKIGAKKGAKFLVAISETSRCLADGMQAASGCTLGHGNAFVENYGKLAIAIADNRVKRGIRVALKQDARNFSPLLEKWMMRLGKLTKDEEKVLAIQLLEIDESYFAIENIEINSKHNFESSEIKKCAKCGDLIPSALMGEEGHCKICSGKGYYTSLGDFENEVGSK